MKLSAKIAMFNITMLCSIVFAELQVTTFADSIRIIDWHTSDHCAFSPVLQVDISYGDSIVVIEHDTSEGIAVCTCFFDLAVSFPNPAPGEYTAYVYRSYTEEYLADTLFYQGSIDFTVTSANSGGEVVSRSSACGGGLSGIDVPVSPDDFQLYPAFPNPFNPSTTIGFEVPESIDLDFSVYTVLGTIVSNEVLSAEPGYNAITWLGCDNEGKPLDSGVYIVSIATSKWRLSQKLLFLK